MQLWVKLAFFTCSALCTQLASGVTMQDKQHPVVKISTAFAPGCPFYNTSVVDNGTIEE